jgi:hypothetical protein
MEKIMKQTWLILLTVVIAGCATVPPLAKSPQEPVSPVRGLCDRGKYLDAMRALPKAMTEWSKYTEKTARTAEGAAGFEYSTTLSAIANKGDSQWGAILDDPNIPYEYKTAMIFEILETRLGKGSVYVGNKSNLIVPRARRIDLAKEMIELKVKEKKANKESQAVPE